MGNKIAVDLNSLLEGKEIGSEQIKQIYHKYSPPNKDKGLKKKQAMAFVEDLFDSFNIPKINEQNVNFFLISIP